MESQSKQNVFSQLKVDEGVVYEIYEDHLGYATFGVGHLVLESDPEHGQSVGTAVSEERVDECFFQDLDIAISECITLYGDEAWGNFPSEVQEVLVNMLFNLGRPRLTKFKNFNAKILEGDYAGAAPEGLDSLWARQVGPRAIRLMQRLEAV
jgi:lysozyme